ncbi:MAG: SOS response-associated peptidase [Fimbriimonadaceae bacterium]|jgi:putative SOS response-associated peptidase YedK|nr:SOS response-associated peptidase [Fimbriimonadaceae bacterium]
MCARYAFRKVSVVLDDLGVAPLPGLEPRDNILPRQNVPVILASDGELIVQELRWGLIPPWAKDESFGDKAINARSESLRDKPSFRQALARKRCIIPATGFYEWKGQKGNKQPFLISSGLYDGFAMAGLYEDWVGSSGIRSTAIITVPANETVSTLHNRMPALLPRNRWRDWLSPDLPQAEALSLLIPDEDHDLRLMPHNRELLLGSPQKSEQRGLF